MNILFVYSLQDICSLTKLLRMPQQIQFGISYISSVLKQSGHNTKLTVLSSILRGRNQKTIEKYITEFKPRMILFTAVSTEYSFMAEIASFIKKKFPNIFLVIGGAHVSLNPEGILNDSFDALCIGEGEYPMLEMASQLEKGIPSSNIQNLWIKKEDHIEKNPPRPFIQDIEALPFPDREMWFPWVSETRFEFSLLLGRGCPFNCTYCCNHALKKLSAGKYVRYRSPQNIMSELNLLVKEHPQVKSIFFEVETIGINMEWAIDLCEHLRAFNKSLAHPLEFSTNLRVIPNKDFDSLFSAFEKSGFTFVNIGVESGSDRVRKEVLKRNYANSDIVNAVRSARKHNLRVCFFNLIGLPEETEDDFKETIEINRMCQPDWYFLSIFYPYPGTELYAHCVQKGLIRKPLNPTMERSRVVIDSPCFESDAVQKQFQWFDYNIYRGYKPLYKMLARVMVTKIKSNPYLNFLYRRITQGGILGYIKNKLRR